MTARLKGPDGRAEVSTLDGADLARVLSVLADRGEPVELPAAGEAETGPVPLVVVERPGTFAAGVVLRPQFGRVTPALRRRSVAFMLASEHDVTVDLGDGAGSRTASPGEVLCGEFQAVPDTVITITREGRVARCRIAFDDAPAPLPTETWTLGAGTAWLLPAAGHASLRCPLIVVEGFPGRHGFLFSHDVMAQHGLLSSLQAQGHDLVVVGLEDGTRPLAENAAVVEAVLAQASTHTDLPVTLLGWSMGGLLARIALSSIERRGDRHRVETLVTWDTPHRGSMTQLGVQWFVENFAAAHPALAVQRALVASPANREMDMLMLGPDGSVSVDPLRDALLAQLCWPQQPQRILVSSGRGDGRCSLQAGQMLAHWVGPHHSEISLRAPGGPQPLASGSLAGHAPSPLPSRGLINWDGVPGGREAYVGRVAATLADIAGGRVTPLQPPSTCVVPTVSALDLDSPPDAPVPPDANLITCESDHPHLVIDAPAAERLLGAIGEPFDPDRFNPHDAGFLADPFPTYARFREFAPVHPVAAYESLWCFRAAECQEILEGTETWLKHPRGAAPVPVGPTSAQAGLPSGLFSADPPAHPLLRGAVEVPLRRTLASVPALAHTHTGRLLEAIGLSERIELVQDYALPLPANVLFDLLGIVEDPVTRSSLIAWQQAITIAHDVSQAPRIRLQGATCAMALRGFFSALVQSHRQSPASGLIGELCDSFAAAGLRDAELEATLCDLLVAGYLSTTFVIATGLWRLLNTPGALSALRADPTACRGAVDELLRLDGPVQIIDRFASAPTKLAGRALPIGSKVTAVIGSADRDPARLVSPDQFQLGREAPLMAFGAGVHHCVGAPLARLVAPLALQALLEFAPSIELDGEPQWQSDPYLRAVTSLPLTLSAGSR